MSLKLQIFEEADLKSSKKILMLHGFGADAHDLRPLAHEIPNASGFHWIFPEAPISVFGAGKAWFPLSQTEINGALNWPERKMNLSQNLSPLEKLYEVFSDGAKSWVFGGFSQGAIMALELALKLPKAPKALLLFSPTYLNREEKKKIFSEKLKDTKIFISHGTSDFVLPFDYSQMLMEDLRDAGCVVDFQPFNDGHTIPRQVMTRVGSFLRSI